ncbi:MAG TPA: cupredoxin family copper-binding protein [Candidatus Eremiobacteraceae bacterium]|nr:cupredoxin family copper-binding protein [Candidatus Eremiobacteraceae bacterium]
MTQQLKSIATFALAAVAAISIGRLTAAADSSSTTASATPTATPMLVTIKDFAFNPSSLSVPVGGSVTFKNLDTASHTASDANGAWDSGNLDTGQSWTYTFTKAGTYKIICKYHPSMKGTIVVGGPAPSPSPAGESGY